MTDDMLKVIVQSLDMILTYLMNHLRSHFHDGSDRALLDQQDKLREVFKKELKNAPNS